MRHTSKFLKRITGSMHYLAVTFLLIGCGAQQININNEVYRQKGSSAALLGSYGKILSDKSYECDGFFVKKIKTSIHTKETYSSTLQSDSNLQASGEVEASQVKADLSPLTMDNNQNYVAIVIAPKDPKELQDALLNKIAKDKFLFEKATNPNFRFISEEVSSLHYSTAANLSHQDDASLELNIIDKIAIKSKGSKQERINLSDRTIIGYQFRKLCWKHGKVFDTVVDLPNVSQNCPSSSSDVYPG